MNIVEIDASKGKSLVAALQPMDAVVLLLKKYPHSKVCSEQMVYAIIALGETTHMVMEIIGLYREPVVATLHEYGIHVTVPIH